MLPGFSSRENKSTWAAVKGFQDNVELEVAATYASSGTQDIDSVADSRGATINVHYSISLLPQTGYQPRLADDRVGYFLTVVKDFSQKGDDDRFVRYINRWDLQKADPSAELSPPEEADHVLARKDDSVRLSQADPRRHPGMEQGLREGRLRQRHRSSPAARQRRLGSGRHQLQHVPLDHGRRRLCHGPLAA